MAQISKQIIKDVIATLDSYSCGAHHPDLLPLLDQPEDANIPDTERCIQNLVIALVESKGWMRSYADAIIRDAIDRMHLLEGKPQKSPTTLQ